MTAVSDERRGGDVILATTTSLIDSGLLDVLTPLFEEASGYRLKPIGVGSGAALAMGARGEADVVFVHAPDAEREWFSQGYGTERLLVMYNDFVIVGPAGDPAEIGQHTSVVAVFRSIASQRAQWVSRDDNSGTHQLEDRLWALSGVDPTGEPWIITTGQGMGPSLVVADQRGAYTLSDRGTYLAFGDRLSLDIAFAGDAALLNLYHVMPINPDAFPDLPINEEGGNAFARFLLSDEVQRIITEYGKSDFGESLFTPAAGMTEADLR